MKQIGNGFMYYYYLTEDGEVYNAKTDKYLAATDGRYHLRTTGHRTKNISMNTLTNMVYGYSVIIDNVERLEGEIFVPIPGTDGDYAISNYGRAISYKGHKVRLLRPAKNISNGYYRINVMIDGKYRSKLIHQLVAEAFCSLPAGQDKSTLQIHHKDFHKDNNYYLNLEYLTPAEHIKKHLDHNKGGQENV